MLARAKAALLCAAFASVFSAAKTAHAGADSQLHVRGGLLSGVYTGPQYGDFSIPNAFDLEYEQFTHNQRSFLFRAIMAMELETSKPYYFYAGTGLRYYFSSKGMAFEAEDDKVSMSAVPRLRYYVGTDVGISQAIIKSLGRVLQVTSTMMDIGGHVGAIYQVDRRLGFEIQFGLTSGQGFSSVSVVGYSARALGGFTYKF
jgi:hypothetical protein